LDGELSHSRAAIPVPPTPPTIRRTTIARWPICVTMGTSSRRFS